VLAPGLGHAWPMAKWQVPPASGSRLPHVEGMRALAAGSIVLYHVWLYADPNGPTNLGPLNRVFLHLPVGVTLFFTLSGFLLYRPFAAALLRDGPRPSIASYFRNRALRILPAYWFVLLMAGLVLGTTLVRFDLQRGFLEGRPGLLARDALFIQNYGPGSMLTGIGPAWSLAIEIVFYLALPALALLAFLLARRASDRTGRRMAAFIPPLLVFLVGISGKLVAAYLVPGAGPGGGWINDWHSVLERSFWVQADLFTFGMILAVVRVEVEDGLLRLPRRWWAATAGATVALAGLTAAAFDRGWVGQYPYDSLMALACGLLLALVILPPSEGRRHGWVTAVLESRAAIWVGLISYSLFLWHEPLVWFLRDHGLTGTGVAGFLLNVVVVGSLSLVVAALTYRFVELPALRRKSRRRVRDPQPKGERADTGLSTASTA
jgi:peptidoglycan/LPS O-acetylase OafA/YrhL